MAITKEMRIEAYKRLIVDCGKQCEQAMKEDNKLFATAFADMALLHSYSLDIQLHAS